MSTPVIRLAMNEKERAAVYRLRYFIYVDEMKLILQEADHERGIITNHLDDTAMILAAFDGDTVIGTATVNFAKFDLGVWADRFRMKAMDRFYPQHVSMTTRFLVAKEYRYDPRAAVVERLALAVFRLLLQERILFDFVCFHPRQKNLAHTLGYRQVIPNITLPGYGESHAMILVTCDRDYLNQVGSPFVTALSKETDDFGSVAFFYENLLNQQEVVFIKS